MKSAPIKKLITEKISGEWGREASDPSSAGVAVIRTANFLNTGKIDFSKIVRREIAQKKVAKKKLLSGDIIIEKSGGSPTQPVGRVVLFNNPDGDIYLCNNFTSILRPNREVIHPEYLFYALFDNHLKGRTLRYQNKTTGIINLKLDNYLNSEIPHPPLADQIRIAHLLGKVEELIAQRKQHLQQLDDLLKSVFLEMFGDPVRNENEWEVKPCDKVVTDIKSGTSYGGEEKKFLDSDELGVLKISAVTQGYFNPREFKAVKKSAIKKTLRFVKKNDLLFSRANTIELVAACCVVSEDNDSLFLPDKLWALTLDESVNIQFFNFLLKNESFRNLVRKQASGGHDSMLNISMKKFRSLSVPVPDQDLQNQFAAIVEKVDGIKSRYQQSLVELENLYGALSQKAFKGELDLSRVPLPTITGDISVSLPSIEMEAHGTVDKEPNPLPDPDDLKILGSTEGRKALIGQWLEVYLEQLGSSSFSAENFMETAQQKLWELAENEAPAWGTAEYEQLKTWVFRALESGRLTQSYDEDGKLVQIKSANG